ncbi:DUF2730 family protein [Roseibium sp.]|uniref:DUF2730 family protein n=1 Tax=Roseibium sp. TaxID=1936156 RepID=UPI003263F6DF
MQEVKEWLGVVGSVLALGGIIYTWMTTRSRMNGEAIAAHERKLGEHDRRIQQVENEVGHLPTKDDFNELSLKLERSNGMLAKIEAEYKGVHQAVQRIERYLTKDR